MLDGLEDIEEIANLVHGDCLCACELQTFIVFVYAQELQLLARALLQGDCVSAGARGDIECATFLRKRQVFVDQLGKPLTPISGDVKVLEKGKFFL